VAANIPNNPVAIQKFFTSRDNNANATTYVGQEQRLWYDPITNAIYVSDGNTAGGIAVGSTGSGNGVPGGLSNTVQYNNSGNFGGDPNFTFNSSTSTLTITNIVTSGAITGGAGGSNTQVLFNDGGNISGDPRFLFNKATNTFTQTGTAFFGNVYAQANNTSNIGDASHRFYDLWLGSGNINLIDDTFPNITQRIRATAGNLTVYGGNGIAFGQFVIYGNTIATQNPTANINIGRVGDTSYLDIERPLAVNSTGGGRPAFRVEQAGTTEIYSYGNILANTALMLVNGTTSGNSQPRNFEGTLIQATAQENTPARMSSDAFGVDGTGQNAYVAWAARVARGNVDAPSQTLAGDTMFRFTGQGWSNSGAYIGSIVRYNQVALENFATGKAGTRHNFAATAVGSATIKNIANIDANGITFSSSGTGGPANTGITFQDGSYQNTAYLSTSVVRSLTAGSGISLSSNTGNITITNTGVLGVTGTTNQINVANVGNVLTLSLPQNFNTTANVQLYSLTVQDLTILGNVSNVTPSVINGKIVYVANTATTLNGIDVSGLYSGNAANNYYAAMLYDTTSNTWQMDIGNSVGITSANVYANAIIANAALHVGQAASGGYDFPNALIQGDLNLDSYGQFVLKNHSQTANASSDIVAVANNGDDGSYYIDMGINSNVYANADYAITGFNDGYLYVNGGNLVIGTQTAGKVVNFFTGGTDNLNKIRGTLSDTGFSVVGNVTANNMISTNATIGGTVSATGNITGGNVLVPAGQISASGNIYGLAVNTGIISATGLVTAANIVVPATGTISALGNIIAGNLNTLGLISAGGAVIAANVAAGNITSAIISATGNITGPNVIATILQVSALLSVSGNITGGNLLTDGIILTTGNVSGNYFIGNGSQLTGISLTRIANGTSNITIATASGNATVGIGGTPNIAVFATTGEYVTGLISASSNVIGANLVGQNLTSGRVAIVGSGKEVSDDAEFTYNSSTNVLSVTGNINAAYFNGNGSLLSSLTGANVTGTVANATYAVSAGSATTATTAGTVTTNAQPNITSVGTLTSVSITANVTGGNIITGGLISATGNINAAYFNGNGSLLSSLTGANVTGTVANATYAISAGSATTATTSATVTTNAQPNITSVGTLTSVSITANVTGGNILTGGLISATGNINAAYFNGNGSLLSSLTGANVTGTVANATYAISAGSATTATTAGTVTTNAQPNITSVGTLTSVSITANVTGGNILTGGLISATSNITGGNLLTGGVQSSTGNVIGGNIVTGGLISATSNITGGNLLTGGVQSSTGNVTGGNIITGGLISATGNITGGNVTAAKFTGNLVGSASNLTVNTSSTAGTWLTGQVNIPAQTIPKNTTSVDVTVTVTSLTTSHKVIVTPAADLNSGIFVTAAYPSSANTLGIQMQNTTGGAITTSAFNLTYMAWE